LHLWIAFCPAMLYLIYSSSYIGGCNTNSCFTCIFCKTYFDCTSINNILHYRFPLFFLIFILGSSHCRTRPNIDATVFYPLSFELLRSIIHKQNVYVAPTIRLFSGLNLGDLIEVHKPAKAVAICIGEM